MGVWGWCSIRYPSPQARDHARIADGKHGPPAWSSLQNFIRRPDARPPRTPTIALESNCRTQQSASSRGRQTGSVGRRSSPPVLIRSRTGPKVKSRMSPPTRVRALAKSGVANLCSGSSVSRSHLHRLPSANLVGGECRRSEYLQARPRDCKAIAPSGRFNEGRVELGCRVSDSRHAGLSGAARRRTLTDRRSSFCERDGNNDLQPRAIAVLLVWR